MGVMEIFPIVMRNAGQLFLLLKSVSTPGAATKTHRFEPDRCAGSSVAFLELRDGILLSPEVLLDRFLERGRLLERDRLLERVRDLCLGGHSRCLL